MNPSATRTGSAAATATPNAVATLTAVATPTAPDRPPAPDAAAASRRFAELLREQTSERAAPPPPPAAASGTAAAAAEDSSSTVDGEPATVAPPVASTTPARPRPANAKSATGKATTAACRAPEADSKHDAAVKDDEATAAAPTTTDMRAAALALLAAANAAQGAAAAGSTPASADTADGWEGSAADVDATSTIATRDDVRRGGVHGRGDAIVDAAGGRSGPVEATATMAAALADAALPATLGNAAAMLHAGSTGATAIDGSGAAAATITAGGAIRADGETNVAAPPASLALATAIDAPEFAATLGVQVSLLAKDGVQHAELHLNPAETGPVSIHIAVDGTAARIDFGADHAATRQAIERGLPELASALRDAGLTLAGGGVSQHASGRQRGGDEPAAAASGRGSSSSGVGVGEAVGTTTARIGRRTAAGGVDLYA
ncbi:MAG TPA: flagellar hook-length control protein FliK [Caldimonas sp.]